MKLSAHLHILTVAIAASYLTLGIFNTDRARALWAPYALVSFALAIVNLIAEERSRR